jgi:pantothenate kinase
VRVPSIAELAVRARSLVVADSRAIIAIFGAPGSGKSTLTNALVDALRAGPSEGRGEPGAAPDEWVAHLPMDGFHLADVELDRLGRRNRKGGSDTFDSAGYVATLRRVRERTDDIVYAPGFERDLEQPIAGAIPIPRAARIIVTEGLYLLHSEGAWTDAAAYFDESWFVSVDDGLRRERLRARHVLFGKSPDEAREWVERVDEPNAQIVESSRSRATLVVDLEALGIGP